MGPLTGVRVVELANGIHGPYAAMLLADMGADVIKVEPPVGDLNRAVDMIEGLPFGSQFYACNRNKRAMCLDLQQDAGREIARALVDDADVVIENMRPGVLERLGLGYDAVAARNPRLIYASATGYGPKGPRAGQPSLDIVGQAAGGLAAHTGFPETGPLPVGAAIADHAGALWLAYGVMLALYARDRTGRGQHIHTSLLGSQIALQAWEMSRFLHKREEPQPAGRGHPHARGAWRFFPTKDGWIALAGITDARWPALCDAVGRPDLRDDPRFAESAQRLEHTEALIAELEAEFQKHETDSLLAALEQGDQIAAKVANYTDLASDPQVLANGYITAFTSETHGELPMVGIPVTLSDTPGSMRSDPPETDQHTTSVLQELGYDWERIGELMAQGAVGAASREETIG